jgi:hypothetical protein
MSTSSVGGGTPAPRITHAPSSSGDAPLTPSGTAPEPTSYRPSTAGYVGYGALGLGLGAVGSMLGMIAADFTSGNGFATKSGTISGAVVGALALGGLAIGLAEDHFARKHQAAEAARIAGSYGSPILPAAREMVKTYDHDKSGAVDLDNPSGLHRTDERLATVTAMHQNDGIRYDWFSGDFNYDSDSQTVRTTTSAFQPFAAADGDSGDRTVTPLELAKLMSTFDSDRSGTLTTSEQQAFQKAYPVLTEREVS